MTTWRGGSDSTSSRIGFLSTFSSPVCVVEKTRDQAISCAFVFVTVWQVPADIEIARAAKLEPIVDVVQQVSVSGRLLHVTSHLQVGIPADEVEVYGRFKVITSH